MRIKEVILLFVLVPTVFGQAAVATLAEKRAHSNDAAPAVENMGASMAILFESGKDGDQVAICRVDVAGRQDLVPKFLSTKSQASGSQASSANSEPELVGLPVCSPEQTSLIATVAAESSRPMYAGAPLALAVTCGALSLGAFFASNSIFPFLDSSAKEGSSDLVRVFHEEVRELLESNVPLGVFFGSAMAFAVGGEFVKYLGFGVGCSFSGVFVAYKLLLPAE